MIKSMTGYGRAVNENEKRTVTVEIKSVNHRFFDFNLRIYRVYSHFEDKIKSMVAKSISRGKVDMYVSIVNNTEDAMEVSLDRALLAGYIDALRTMKDDYGLRDDISVMTVSGFHDIFSVKKNEDSDEEIFAQLEETVNAALAEFEAMRQAEGRRLKDDLKSYCDVLENGITFFKERSPETVRIYREKLTEKLNELLSESTVDEQRVVTEAAIFADKIAVDEEMARLSSHIEQFLKMLDSDKPTGKKMDFLVQEMNREVNTTGSKANDIEMSKMVVEMKSEIEKIREQIQNIE